MSRKRAPEHDYICRRCRCACNPPGGEPRHLGGGPGMRACGRPPDPVLRSELEAEQMEDARAAAAAIRHLMGGGA